MTSASAPGATYGPRLSFLRARRPGRPVVVMGTSMGAAAAIFAAGELGHRVQGYILESPYQDLKTAAWNRTDVYLPPVLSHAAYLGLRAVGPLFLPNLDEISPLKVDRRNSGRCSGLDPGGRCRSPGSAGGSSGPYRQVATHGRLVLFPGAGHHNLPGSAPDLFNQTLLKFCRQVAGPPKLSSSL